MCEEHDHTTNNGNVVGGTDIVTGAYKIQNTTINNSTVSKLGVTGLNSDLLSIHLPPSVQIENTGEKLIEMKTASPVTSRRA